MPTIVRHIRIEAPRERVWDVLTDVPRQPAWMRDLRSIHRVTPGPVAVGSVMVGEVRMFGISQSDPVEVTVVEAPERYAIAHRGAFSGWGELLLLPLDSGSATHVCWTERLAATSHALPLVARLAGLPGIGRPIESAAGILARLVDPLLVPVFGWVFREDLRRLKRLIEAG